MALGECGRLPLCTSHMPICVKYWLKLIRMENTRYPKSCYEMLWQLDSIGRYTWATNIKNMLYLYGFGYNWIAQDVGNDENFTCLFKQRIADCFTQQWFSNIENTHKASAYKQFKSLLHPELYLSAEIPFLYRKKLSNFRCSNHGLMIEKCRLLGIDRELRDCPLCRENNILIVENEYRFFFVCPTYESLRVNYFMPCWLHSRNEDVFNSIMKLSELSTSRTVAKFLAETFNLRKHKLSSFE